MEIEINEKKNNPLFKRTEVYFTVVHPNEATPNRAIIQNELAEALNTKKDHVIIDRINSGFGIQKTKGYAKVYSSRNVAESIERKHQITRNLSSEPQAKKEKKESALEESPAEPPQEEPSTEKPKEESTEGDTAEQSQKEKEATE